MGTLKRLFNKIRFAFRDSRTGRYVSALFAKSNPDTTQKERRK